MKRLMALLLLVGTACTGTGQRQPLTVFAASSLTLPFTEIGRAFEKSHPGARVRFSFAASSGLAQQLIAGAPADVFASASPTHMNQVIDVVGEPLTFATNAAAIATAPGSSVRSLTDLARTGMTVALCESTVPCGALAETVLRKAGLAVRPVTRGLDVKSTLAQVTNGSVEAAIVYVTDVRAAGDKVRGVPIPAAVNDSVNYQLAALRSSTQGGTAEAFVAYVLSEAGQAVLAAAGFTPP